MDVFSLRDTVIDEYKKFATSFTRIHTPDDRAEVAEIYARDHYWPDPLIQLNPKFKQTTTVEQQVTDDALDPKCGEVFRGLAWHRQERLGVAFSIDAGESP